nr:helix-turn-helix transcriptional regulator [uncultured Pedobacter sp.]
MKDTNCNQCIAEFLLKIRVKKRYSQNFVALSVGISLTAYKAWENGKIDFTINKLEKYVMYMRLIF